MLDLCIEGIGRAIDKIVKDLILTVVHGGSNIIERFVAELTDLPTAARKSFEESG